MSEKPYQLQTQKKKGGVGGNLNSHKSENLKHASQDIIHNDLILLTTD